ncbi:MAG: undecaprenyl-diphosphate phosphatase [Gemmatimonadota bacterium]|nr:MAG: undecaprenyl-diphosphate phosphatase [Gemmatimonadota bacterium]
MSSWEAALLGILQGVTEFLPVSSSGHLVVGQAILGLELPGVAFEVAVHVATLLSVVLVYRERLFGLAVGAAKREGASWRYLGFLALATLPAAVVGIAFRSMVEGLYDSTWVTGVSFLVTGGLLWSARSAQRRDQRKTLPGAKEAGLIGLAQAFALVPGISRSGITVVAALWLGLEAREAATFSFLMSIPAIAGAAVLEAPALLAGSAPVGGTPLVVGAGLAAIVGVAAIRTFVAVLASKSFHRFAFYVWGLGIAVLAGVVLAT